MIGVNGLTVLGALAAVMVVAGALMAVWLRDHPLAFYDDETDCPSATELLPWEDRDDSTLHVYKVEQCWGHDKRCPIYDGEDCEIEVNARRYQVILNGAEEDPSILVANDAHQCPNPGNYKLGLCRGCFDFVVASPIEVPV